MAKAYVKRATLCAPHMGNRHDDEVQVSADGRQTICLLVSGNASLTVETLT